MAPAIQQWGSLLTLEAYQMRWAEYLAGQMPNREILLHSSHGYNIQFNQQLCLLRSTFCEHGDSSLSMELNFSSRARVFSSSHWLQFTTCCVCDTSRFQLLQWSLSSWKCCMFCCFFSSVSRVQFEGNLDRCCRRRVLGCWLMETCVILAALSGALSRWGTAASTGMKMTSHQWSAMEMLTLPSYRTEPCVQGSTLSVENWEGFTNARWSTDDIGRSRSFRSCVGSQEAKDWSSSVQTVK